MATRLLTEDGKYLVTESIPGLDGISALNDAASLELVKETFSTNPVANGWSIGDRWLWSSVNGNIQTN